MIPNPETGFAAQGPAPETTSATQNGAFGVLDVKILETVIALSNQWNGISRNRGTPM